jgi:hypothetical protein
MNRPVTRRPAGEINFHLIKKKKKKKKKEKGGGGEK